MKFGISLPPFDEPEHLVALAKRIETAGWDGCFLWDHILGSSDQPMPIVDPWVVLGAMAESTDRLRLGTVVTPLARRRPQVVAREVVTLDRLSAGRAVLGVGLGSPIHAEYGAFGEPTDSQLLGEMLDESLELIAALWTGERVSHHGPHYHFDGGTFLPVAVQQPRVPIWVACTIPHHRPLLRAACWDGIILARFIHSGQIGTVTPSEVRSTVADLTVRRPRRMNDFDVVVLTAAEFVDAASLADAGATWCLRTGWGDKFSKLIDAGPLAEMSQPG